jgi:uncharacterized protein YggE
MGITVSGVGEATGRPDVVDVDVGISILADTVAGATSAAADRAQAVSSALASAGIATEDLATTEYSIRPEYDYSANAQRLVGYRVSNLVRVRLRDISATGPLLDAVSSAAGDDTRVNGLTFGVADEKALQAEAREAAWKDALATATQLAELSGHTLGPATSITDMVRPPVSPVRMLAADMGMEKSTPIQPGSTTISVTLQVEFDLAD